MHWRPYQSGTCPRMGMHLQWRDVYVSVSWLCTAPHHAEPVVSWTPLAFFMHVCVHVDKPQWTLDIYCVTPKIPSRFGVSMNTCCGTANCCSLGIRRIIISRILQILSPQRASALTGLVYKSCFFQYYEWSTDVCSGLVCPFRRLCFARDV